MGSRIVVKEVEAAGKVKATTSIRAGMEALRHIGARRIAIASATSARSPPASRPRCGSREEPGDGARPQHVVERAVHFAGKISGFPRHPYPFRGAPTPAFAIGPLPPVCSRCHWPFLYGMMVMAFQCLKNIKLLNHLYRPL